MKKFFKALALVLALTLVIGTIPASAASAKFTVKKNTKVIYIDGSKGEKEDGTKCKTLSKFTVTKWIEGFDADTMDLKLKTADKTIASKNNKYDRVYAKGIGTVKVTLYIYEKADKGNTPRLLQTIDNFKVKVKKNVTEADKVANAVYVNEKFSAAVNGKITFDDIAAAKITVDEIKAAVSAAGVTKDDLVAVEEGSKLGVNTPYFVRLTRLDADGNYTDTDARRLLCLDKDGNAVKDVAIVKLSNTLFLVVFGAAGEYTFTAQAYQSGKFKKALASENFKLTVGYDISAVKQESLNEVKATFETPVKGLDAKNFKLQYKVGETFVDFAGVESVTAVADDPTSVIVKFYRNFTEGTTYYLTYDGQDALEFPAVVVTIDSVENVVVTSKKVEAGTWSSIDYKLVDKDGVNITASTKLKGNTEFSFDPANAENGFNYQKKEMRIAKASDTPYTLKVKYSWKSADGKDSYKEGTAQITAVAAAPWEAGVATGVITKRGAGLAYKAADGSRDTNVKELADFTMSEASSGAAVSILVPLTRTNAATGAVEKKFDTTFTANSGVLYSKYELKSSSEDVVMIGGLVGGSGADKDNFTLIANHEGTAQIIIYGVEKVAPYNKVVVGAIDVEVKAARKPASFNVIAKNQKQNLNAAFSEDSVVFTLELKDQYGEDFAGSVKITCDQPDGNTPYFLNDSTNKSFVETANGVKEWNLKATQVTYGTTVSNVTSKVMNLKFEWLNSNLGSAAVKLIPVSVSNDNDAKSYVLKLSGEKLSTNFKPDSVASSVTIKLEGRNSEDFVASGRSIFFTKNAPETGARKTDFEDGKFYYTVAKDGVLLDGNKTGFDSEKGVFTNLTVSGTAIQKLAAGTYTVTAYQVTYEGTDAQSVAFIGQQTLTVVNDQEALVSKKTKDVSSISVANLLDAFETKFQGVVKSEYFNSGDYKIAGDGKSAYVYKVRYTVVNNTATLADKTTPNSLYNATFERYFF